MNLSILGLIKEPSGCLVVVNHDANALNSLQHSHILVLTLPGITLFELKKTKKTQQLKVIITHFQHHEYIFCHNLCVVVTMTADFLPNRRVSIDLHKLCLSSSPTKL